MCAAAMACGLPPAHGGSVSAGNGRSRIAVPQKRNALLPVLKGVGDVGAADSEAGPAKSGGLTKKLSSTLYPFKLKKV